MKPNLIADLVVGKAANGIAQQIANLETQLEEHNLVLNTIKGMDDSRTCYRLIGGVLVEKNVGKVRPEVVDQTKRLAAVVGQMREQIQKLEVDSMTPLEAMQFLQQAKTELKAKLPS